LAKQVKKQDAYADSILQWSKYCANLAEDCSRAIIGFIPNGFNVIYDKVLKSLPLVGNFFSQRLVEQLFKLVLGITIGQGLATDVSMFVFRPLGYMIGTLIGGTCIFGYRKIVPVYQGRISKLSYKLAGQTVGGALVGMFVLVLLNDFSRSSWFSLSPQTLYIAALIGALIGLMTKTMFLVAVNMVNTATVSAARKNVQRAKELNAKLKVIAKQKAKGRVLIHAQDLISQMNGPQSQSLLENFFLNEFENIALNTYKKIDRHFNYLTDRVCHGDVKALKRLQELNPIRATIKAGSKSALDLMLDRIFNNRAVFRLKNDVDNAFDYWQYRHLKSKEAL